MKKWSSPARRQPLSRRGKPRRRMPFNRRFSPSRCGVSMSSLMTALKATATIERSMVEQIVREVALEYLKKAKNGSAPVLAVQTSSRHMHICRADMDVLFGLGTELTFDRPL